MGNDLISRKALMNKICNRFNIPNDWDGDITEPLQTVIDIIDNMPTAYDVEKVIQQLREQDGTCTGCNHSPDECAWCSVKERLDIVRKGGVE